MGRTGENKQKVHRAPEVSPELWRTSTAKQKAEAIASYKAELEAAILPVEPKRGLVAAASSGVPKLPRIDGPAENGPTARKTRKSRPRSTLVVSLPNIQT